MNKILFTLIILSVVSGCSRVAPTVYMEDVTVVREAIANKKRLALIPLQNITATKRAGDRVTKAALAGLFNLDLFEIISEGEVIKVLSEEKVRWRDQIPSSTLEKIAKKLKADIIVMGSVTEYKQGEPIRLALQIKMIDMKNRSVLFEAGHAMTGTDREGLFEIGRIRSMDALARRTVREILDIFRKDLFSSEKKPLKIKKKEPPRKKTKKEKRTVRKKVKKKPPKTEPVKKSKKRPKKSRAKKKHTRKSKKDFQRLYGKGHRLAVNGENEKALKYLLKAEKIIPDNIDCLNYTGISYYVLEDYDRAKKYFKKVLDIDPDNEQASEFLQLLNE